MLSAISPLRYPGGKSCLYPLVSDILQKNKIERSHYVEPYAGGCGLALTLLYEGHVSDIHINDIDKSIWAFWSSVLNHWENLINLITHVPITIKEWERQREINIEMDIRNPLKLGFSTFFLNRTNRSGIIKGEGVIGGRSQNGNYKMDCRFNRNELADRIRRIAKYRNQIHLTRQDAIPFMARMESKLPKEAFFCIDPPYFNKGASLYTNFYGPHEHENVATSILSLSHHWLLTYDNTREIEMLYNQNRRFLFDINYSLQSKRIGSELLIVSKGLRLPMEIKKRQL